MRGTPTTSVTGWAGSSAGATDAAVGALSQAVSAAASAIGRSTRRARGKVMADESEAQRQSVMKMPKQTFVKPTAAQLDHDSRLRRR